MDDCSSFKLDPFVEAIAKVISINEGDYNAINRYDGYASSIGILQWHGFRAKQLLMMIACKNREAFTSSLEGTAILEDLEKDNAFWNQRILTDSECHIISHLLVSLSGVEAQKELLTQDISAYICHGKTLGISDKSALAFFADLENQLGYKQAEEIIKSIPPEQELTMHTLLTASLPYSTSERTIRSHRTYTNILNANL